MHDFFPFFLVIFAGVFFTLIFRRIHIPWVVALILGGMALGPYGLEVLEVTPVIDFLSQIGLIFLMFMAGLETKLSSFNGFQEKLIGLAFINGAVPFFAGFGVAWLFGYQDISAILVGIIFISSSIAIVIPSLERHKLLHTQLGQSVVMTSVMQDIASLVLLSLVLQNISPITVLPLYIFYPLVLGVLIGLRYLLPRAITLFTFGVRGTEDFFQQEFRAVFLILLGTVVSFEILGLHPIIAGFFAGFILSGTISSPILKDKIHAISYGIFIPTFFILVGAKTDLSMLFTAQNTALLALAIIASSIFSKFISGWIGGKLTGFTSGQSLLFAVSSIPQLSTTLAVAFTAFSLGIIDQALLTAMVALSVGTVVVSPTLMNLFSTRIARSLDASTGPIPEAGHVKE